MRTFFSAIFGVNAVIYFAQWVAIRFFEWAPDPTDVVATATTAAFVAYLSLFIIVRGDR